MRVRGVMKATSAPTMPVPVPLEGSSRKHKRAASLTAKKKKTAASLPVTIVDILPEARTASAVSATIKVKKAARRTKNEILIAKIDKAREVLETSIAFTTRLLEQIEKETAPAPAEPQLDSPAFLPRPPSPTYTPSSQSYCPPEEEDTPSYEQ